MKDIEILDSGGNVAVVKHIGRSYPGVLLQGDTLRIMLDDINELQEALDVSNLGEVKEIAKSLELKLVQILNHYENILDQHGLSLPYVNAVKKY